MLVRLLGKEQEAKAANYSHPFTDVPSWADSYVGYMYHEGLTNGVGNNLYGSSDVVNTSTYTTFILRVLGYDDSQGDFVWTEAVTKAVEVGIVDEEMANTYRLNDYHFLRGDLAHLSYQTLSSPLKDQEMTLAAKLISENVFTVENGIEVGLNINGIDLLNEEGDSVEMNFEQLSTDTWMPQVKMTIDRESLPESIKDFAYVFSGGISKPGIDVLEYYLHIHVFESVGRDLERMKNKRIEFDDVNGIELSFHNYTVLTFYSSDKKFLGYTYFDGVKNGNVTSKLYTYQSIDEIEKPEAYTALIAQYMNMPTFHDSINITVLDESAYLTFGPKILPSNLQDAAYIDFGGTSFDEYNEVLIYYYLADKEEKVIHNSKPIGDELINLTTTIRENDNGIVRLYNGNSEIIAVSIIKPAEFKTSDSRYVYFKGLVSNEARISSEDFTIERYIDGVIDNSFDGFAGYGTNYDGEGYAAFKTGPLFIGDGNIEYKFTSHNEDLIEVVLEHY